MKFFYNLASISAVPLSALVVLEFILAVLGISEWSSLFIALFAFLGVITISILMSKKINSDEYDISG
jgi:hypothetical protein